MKLDAAMLQAHGSCCEVQAATQNWKLVHARRSCTASSEPVVRRRWERATTLLHDHRSCISSGLATLGRRQSLHEPGQEATHVGVARTIGVNKLLLRQCQDRMLCALPIDAHDGGVAPLRDD